MNSLISMPFSISAVFCFTSSTLAKRFTLRNFFIQGNKKKVAWGEIRRIGRVGHGGHAIFGQKLLNTQRGVGAYAYKLPNPSICVERVFKKNLLKLNAASHNNASRYTDMEGFLEHPHSRRSLYYKGPTLQKIILFLGGPPS